MSQKPKVLFVCTGNSARSQMAEALLRHRASDRFEVFSAGLEPRGINPLAIQVMDEIGLDIRHQRSKSVGEFLGKVAINYAIFVCQRAEQSCPHLYPFAPQTLSWPFDDPAAQEGSADAKLAKFRAVRDEIDRRIGDWLAQPANRPTITLGARP